MFGPEIIQVYPVGTQLTHSYTDSRTDGSGEPIDFQKAKESLDTVKIEVFSWYKGETGQNIDTYHLGDMLETVREKFWNHLSFQSACASLGLEERMFRDINIPWFNEISAGEVSYGLEGQVAHVGFRPMHSFEVLLTRAGYDFPIKGSSIDGLVFTAPDEESDQGHVVLGIRGGNTSYSNTYHVTAAGTLRVTEGLKTGNETIQDVWLRDEFRPELGELKNQRILEVRPYSRVIDHLLNRGNATYVFSAKLDLTKKEFEKLWSKNDDPDKGEHSSLVFIPANSGAVNGFIRDNFKGKVENKKHRGDEERVLLPSGAFDLASFSGMSPEELGSLYQEGDW